ncbi:MAG: hypothetical protein QM784_11915 [Polyangiaceae bacterium]
MKSIPLRLLLGAAHRRVVSLPGELTGYLVLGILDAFRGHPPACPVVDAQIQEDGRVVFVESGPTTDLEVARALRTLLDRMLGCASTTPPVLQRIALAKGNECAALSRELETALIPVNRAAGRRALARLVREVLQAGLVEPIDEIDWPENSSVEGGPRNADERCGVAERDRLRELDSVEAGDWVEDLDVDVSSVASCAANPSDCGSELRGCVPGVVERTLPLARVSPPRAVLASQPIGSGQRAGNLEQTPILSKTAPLPAIELGPRDVAPCANHGDLGANIQESARIAGEPEPVLSCIEALGARERREMASELDRAKDRPSTSPAHEVEGSGGEVRDVVVDVTAALPLVRRLSPNTGLGDSSEWDSDGD